MPKAIRSLNFKLITLQNYVCMYEGMYRVSYEDIMKYLFFKDHFHNIRTTELQITKIL